MTTVDDISNAELGRMLSAMGRDHREDLREVMSRLDSFVLKDVYTVEKAGQESRLTALEVSIKDEKAARQGLVRWVITGLILPTAALAATLITYIQGGTGT